MLRMWSRKCLLTRPLQLPIVALSAHVKIALPTIIVDAIGNALLEKLANEQDVFLCARTAQHLVRPAFKALEQFNELVLALGEGEVTPLLGILQDSGVDDGDEVCTFTVQFLERETVP